MGLAIATRAGFPAECDCPVVGPSVERPNIAFDVFVLGTFHVCFAGALWHFVCRVATHCIMMNAANAMPTVILSGQGYGIIYMNGITPYDRGPNTSIIILVAVPRFFGGIRSSKMTKMQLYAPA